MSAVNWRRTLVFRSNNVIVDYLKQQMSICSKK